MDWSKKRVLVTGGASFIGSHLVDALVARGAQVRVVDNMSSGLKENLSAHLESGAIELREQDLLDPGVTERAMQGIDTVFHNAADHGGRGYIDLHEVNCSTNMILDGQVFRYAERAGVEKVVFASSGCVYPTHLQSNPDEAVYLKEDLIKPPYAADNLYGWAKLMGELVLRAYHHEGRMKSVCLRYFTAYGPRCPESHAVVAMIARAHIDQNPFQVWGTGQQVRNWTHVDDIVEGTILAAEKVDDGRGINLGTTERTKVVDAVKDILRYMGKSPELQFDPSKPTGPYNRVCDNSLARELLGWTPKISFQDGVQRTIEWYCSTYGASQVRESLERTLTERTHRA